MLTWVILRLNKILTGMSGLTDILCHSFRSQSEHFLFFPHRILDNTGPWHRVDEENLPKYSGREKNKQNFAIQILSLYRRLQLRLPRSVVFVTNLSYCKSLSCQRKLPSQRTITSSSSSSTGALDTLARFAFFKSCCSLSSSWESSAFLFLDGAGSSTTISSSSMPPNKRARLN